MKKKVTLTKFFRVEWKVLGDLWRQDWRAALVIILLYNSSMAAVFTELKFLEFVTNEAALLGAGKEAERLILGSLAFLALLLFFKLANSIYYVISEKYDDAVRARIKERLTQKLASISYEYYERQETYEKINIAGQAVENYTNAVYGAMKIIRVVCMLVVYCVMLSEMGVLFTLVLISSVFICGFLCGIVSDKQLDYWRKHVHPKTRRNNYFKEIFSSRVNQQNIQTQGSYSYFSGCFLHYNRAARRSYLKLNALTEVTEIVGNLLFIVAFLIAALMLGKRAAEGGCEIGYFTMVIALLGSMFENLKSFTLFLLNNNEFIRIVSDYYEVLEWQEEQYRGLPDSAVEGEAAILVRNLRYRYPQAENPALRGIELKVRQGEKIAIVGENGCGKTTLMSIIMGLLTSYEGTCDREAPICAAVLQDFIEYELTVRENIELGCNGNPLQQDRLERILKQVGLYDYVMSLEQGYDTKLGQLDNGVELSKGQWQRLAVGRLLADERAELWILDEPAAYLDPLAEIDIYKLIFKLAGERTVLFTSHRLGFARFAERVIVMKDGQVQEDGSHEALMRLNGLYAQMFEIQRKWYR
ncbi:MAG: ABC transporter ATP-binding protein [Lachnospiraceae bacterium]|jgi:ATP-binding cassette subfamily B protein|nr:ABC transporter ATP-binding protein [Lachnospiraceae bacterium]